MGTRAAPPQLGHPWQKRHIKVHIAISEHVGTPPHTRGTNGKIIGRHKGDLRKLTIS